MNVLQQLWAFFASVQLAIFTLSCIAISSIIGTLVPQGETHAEYVRRFGEKTALFFHILDIPTMYSSWWFVGLLGLLATNLIICSFDRFPTSWRAITSDHLEISPARLEKMACSRRWTIPAEVPPSFDWQQLLGAKHTRDKAIEHGILRLWERGKWSRLGVYLVHASILVIFAGAIIGQLYGFKGNVMIPELRETDHIYGKGDTTIPLGFTVRCQSFAIDFYENGMVKAYRSRLSILENSQEVLNKEIVVNSPLEYKGITFYQSSYQPHQEFILEITVGNNPVKRFALPFQQEGVWEDQGLRFGILNAEGAGQRAVRAKLWFKAGEGDGLTRWLADGETATLTIEGIAYAVKVKQLYATGLQVAKDPGVWVVYGGCFLLLFGLYLAFFRSHQRIWLATETQGDITTITLAGLANKNKLAFTRSFHDLCERIERTLGTPPKTL